MNSQTLAGFGFLILFLVGCSEKDETIVKYSVLNDQNNLFASKYLLYLPKEEELRQLIEQDRLKFELDNND